MQFLRTLYLRTWYAVIKKILLNFNENFAQFLKKSHVTFKWILRNNIKENFSQFLCEFLREFHTIFKRVSYTYSQTWVTKRPQMDHKLSASGLLTRVSQVSNNKVTNDS